MRLFSLLRLAAKALVLIFVASLLATGLIIADGLHDRLGHADVGLVLGNTVNLDGSPSPRLEARLDKTLALYQSGYFPTIITSGAIGKEGHDKAIVMKAYLVDHGVPSSAVLFDSHGNTTLASAQNFSQFAKQAHIQSVFLVSQYFHLPRSRFIFQQCRIPNVYTAHADFFELRDIYSSLRETVAFLSYLVRHHQCGT